MRIQFVVCMFLVLLLTGCQTAGTKRIAGSHEFVSAYRPQMTVSMSPDYIFINEEDKNYKNTNMYGRSSGVQDEAYFYMNADDSNRLRGSLAITISTLKNTRWSWQNYKFENKNALAIDNNNGTAGSDFRTMIILSRKEATPQVEYLESRGYKIPELMVKKILVKTSGANNFFTILVFSEALSLPKYDSVNWEKALKGEGPERDKAVKIVEASFSEQVTITE